MPGSRPLSNVKSKQSSAGNPLSTLQLPLAAGSFGQTPPYRQNGIINDGTPNPLLHFPPADLNSFFGIKHAAAAQTCHGLQANQNRPGTCQADPHAATRQGIGISPAGYQVAAGQTEIIIIQRP